MKSKHALVVVGIILGLLILWSLGMNWYASSPRGRMAAIEKAGGLDALNREAVTMLNKYGTNESRFLYGMELIEFPATAALGNSVGIFVDMEGTPAYISVRSGTHRNYEVYLIFNPAALPNQKFQSKVSQLTSNIFYLK